MSLIVQKYGGTSVGSVERIQAVAQRIMRTVNQGHQVVVVLSAMGKTTDSLVALAQEISPNPSRREMDMLLATGEQVSIALMSMALQNLGQAAISLTGAQVGIVTEAAHSRARILEIKTDRIQRHLNLGEVVVVAGFQGVSRTEDLEITTLGRGGSDTSAVALAAALGAERCEIYTDVPGILSTDPRIVPEARLMKAITSDEMLELASLGAKVLHPRAVEIARNYGVALVVLSSWTDDPGTKVVSPVPVQRSLVGLEITKAVDGLELDREQGKLALLHIPDRPGVAAKVFGALAAKNIDVDLIIQSVHEGNSNDIAFSVGTKDLANAHEVAQGLAEELQGQATAFTPEEDQVAKITLAGAGMIGRPGIAATMFRTLAEAGINIQMISTSEVKVSCLIAPADSDRAVAALCEQFDLDPQTVGTRTPQETDAVPVRGVALDINQARLAIRHVPDRPGMAAQLFGHLAEKNISVDMIIQSQRVHTTEAGATRDIAFTVGAGDGPTAQALLQERQGDLGFGEISLDPYIAKVSIVGSGMIGHPGIAARFFESLAHAGINIQMIATSDIRISCVVTESEGKAALKVVHEAFNLSGDSRVEMPT